MQGIEPDEAWAEEAWLMESWPLDPINFSLKALLLSVDDLLDNRSFRAGEFIVRQGQSFKEMYYVREGEVEILHMIESDSEGDDDLEEVGPLRHS